MKRILKGLIAAGAMAAAPALAQEAAPPAAPSAQAATATDANVAAAASPDKVTAIAPSGAADGCELHVFPAERMRSLITGWLSGFGAIGAAIDASSHAKQNANNQSLLATALDSPSQIDALNSLDLRGLLKLSPATTIYTHSTPVDRHTMNKIKDRRSDSKAACYQELIVADVLYQKAAIYGRSLKTLFMVRDFGTDNKIDFEYKAWGGNGLKLFPPKEGEDAVAALDELVSVFKKNFTEYAGNEARAPRTPEKR